MGRTTESDAELIAASRDGDAAAFGAIVERYQRAVYAVAYAAREQPAADIDAPSATTPHGELDGRQVEIGRARRV
jgi:hypothetical protein